MQKITRTTETEQMEAPDKTQPTDAVAIKEIGRAHV
jgi:hypothetical protein